jgi:hypothetical protein
MRTMKYFGVLAILAIPGALGGCDTVKSLANAATSGGQTLDVPDDSVKRPPLTLPPDFNLRPPATANGVGATDFTAAQQGRQAVFGLDQGDQPKDGGVQRKAGRTLGESALLQHAGASASSGGIRKQVDQQTRTLSQQEKSFTNNLLNPPQDQPAAKSDDQGILGGVFDSAQKPVIERSGSGTFGNLF